MSLRKGFTQDGSNADNILTNAYLKGTEEGANWDHGYQAVLKDAEVEPYDQSSEVLRWDWLLEVSWLHLSPGFRL